MLKKFVIGFTMLSVVVLASASSGGGGNKKHDIVKSGFKPVSNASGFSLKAGIQYTGSHILNSIKDRDFVMYNTVFTYQNGNTVYILPYKYKLNTTKPCFKSNLNVLDLKVNLHR
jgi:hypothetical protein